MRVRSRPSTKKTTPYDETFYQETGDGSLESARVVVPMILKLTPVRSVVDFGCGEGAWLLVFQDHGVETILGIDGDYVNRERLLIDQAHFRPKNLALPVRLDRTYDLAISLEVAEHLPTRASRSFVESLVRGARRPVLRGDSRPRGNAAHQRAMARILGGTFPCCGYSRLDLIRPNIHTNKDVELWYRQNIYIYANDMLLTQLREAMGTTPEPPFFPLELIDSQVLRRYKFVRGLSRELFRAVIRSIKNRLAGLP